jgi:hypothetical protein
VMEKMELQSVAELALAAERLIEPA